MMSMLHIPDHQSLLHAMVHTLRLMCDVQWNHNSVFAHFQYSAQMCITPMQAQVSMLMKHHQLMTVKYDADRIFL